jgi:hypothetical protein
MSTCGTASGAAITMRAKTSATVPVPTPNFFSSLGLNRSSKPDVIAARPGVRLSALGSSSKPAVIVACPSLAVTDDPP